MSGSWRDGAALRRAIEAADVPKSVRQACRMLVAPPSGWIVTMVPPTVEPQSFRDGRDLAAMAQVEGWR